MKEDTISEKTSEIFNDEPGVPDADPRDGILCSNCMTINSPDAHFCEQCAMPLTHYATNSPLGQVYTLGFAARRSTEGPVRGIFVLGMWLIFGLPALVGTIQIANVVWGIGSGLIDLAQGSQMATFHDWQLRIGQSWDDEKIFNLSPSTIVGLVVASGLLVLYWAVAIKVTWRYLRGRRSVEKR